MGPTTMTAYSGEQFGASSTGVTYGPTSTPTLAQLINFYAGSRTTRFRFDLEHADRSYKGDITPYVTSATIQHDTTRAVKRTLTLDMVETVASQTVTVSGGVITSAGIAYNTDLVHVVCLIQAPAGWLHFGLGTFRFTRPGVTAPGYAIVRHAEMPDLSSIVQQNQATDSTANGVGVPLTLPEGANIADVIYALLTNSATNVQSNPATLSNLPGCDLATYMPNGTTNAPNDFLSSGDTDALIPPQYTVPEGTSYLDLINELLYYCGHYNLMCDDNGVFRTQKWPPNQDYTSLASQYTYDTRTNSIILPGLTEEILLDDLANVVEVVVEDGSRATFHALAVNNDAGSPFSVANLGRRPKVIHDPGVPTNGTSGVNYAQQYAKQQLLMASWLTDTVNLPIAVNPLHGMGKDEDVVTIIAYQQYVAAGSPQNNPIITSITLLPGLDSGDLFLVHGWTITIGLPMPGANVLAGSPGLSTTLEVRDTKQTNTMLLLCHRITSTVNPANITVS